MRLIRLFFVLGLLFAGVAQAHDARPAYLEIRQTSATRYDILWRVPVMAGMPLPVLLELPKGTKNVTEPAVHELSDSRVERRVIEAPGGLAGQRIGFPGLQGTIADVLVRIETTDGGMSTTLVRGSQPWMVVAAPTGGAFEVFTAFVGHGVEHILFGYDHLLFVLALMLIVRNTRALILTVTAFTLAHSITLALATLGIVHVPRPPVEAAIAFSIVLVAAEILRQRAGEPSLTATRPWLIAFCFGLLHGFGFASALSEIGLPQGDIPLALLAFNVGVELGQLAFIGVVLSVAAVVRRVLAARALPGHLVRLAPYAIGSLAAFWFVERVAAFTPV
ncbi:MAG: HupE/UreJ family protein [Steroidobacteraceae bacterium]